MRGIRSTSDRVTFLARHLGRAVAAGADRLGFVKFYSLPVIDLGTEREFNGIHVRA